MKTRIFDRVTSFEGIDDELFYYFYCMNVDRFSNNGRWKSIIIDDIFRCGQMLLFAMNKENLSVEGFARIIRFFVFLRTKSDGDILVESDFCGEMCVIKENEILWTEEAGANYADLI